MSLLYQYIPSTLNVSRLENLLKEYQKQKSPNIETDIILLLEPFLDYYYSILHTPYKTKQVFTERLRINKLLRYYTNVNISQLITSIDIEDFNQYLSLIMLKLLRRHNQKAFFLTYLTKALRWYCVKYLFKHFKQIHHTLDNVLLQDLYTCPLYELMYYNNKYASLPLFNKQIINMHINGLSLRQISSYMFISKSTVANIINDFKGEIL